MNKKSVILVPDHSLCVRHDCFDFVELSLVIKRHLPHVVIGGKSDVGFLFTRVSINNTRGRHTQFKNLFNLRL